MLSDAFFVVPKPKVKASNPLPDHVFALQYDRNRSGALEIEELHAVLADLGIMVSAGLMTGTA